MHAPTPAPNDYVVVLRDEAPYFTPAILRVPRGATVRWENRGPALTHTVRITSAGRDVSSGRIEPGARWSHTFADSGVAVTQCEIHPYMAGQVAAGAASLMPPDTATAARAHAAVVPARVLEFTVPVPNSVPGIVAVDAHDNVWFTLGGGGWAGIAHPPVGKIGRMRLGDTAMTIIDMPTPASGPSGLAVSADGRIYVTELMAGRIAVHDPRTSLTREYPIPTPTSWPTGLAFGRHGELWFSETKGNKIARLSPSGVITELSLPTEGASPTGLVVDSAGDVWFSERDRGKVGRLTADGTLLEYSLGSSHAKPTGLAVDADGRIWVAQRQANKVAVIDRDVGVVREFALPHAHSGPFFIAIGPDRMVWFTQTFGNRIARLNPADGTITEFAVPTRDSWPGGIAFDRAGNLWFTEQLANRVGVILGAASAAASSPSTGGHRQ